MTFAHPQLLWLLALPAALLLAAAFARVRAGTEAHPKIARANVDRAGLSFRDSALLARRPVAAALALAGLVAALARPQGAAIATPTLIQARDVLVAVDVSRSMLADDIAPSRLARARLLVHDLADALRGERLGLLPFAGTAFLQSPLSADYEIFRTFLDELGPDMIPAGGSDFAGLLRAADEAFGPPDSTAPGAPLPPDRYLIVLSDGEAQDASWRPIAEKLAARGVRVIALGVGTAAGAMVPDGQGGLVKDERGAVVLTRLNPSTLQDLARVTEGAYRDASAWVDVPALLAETVARGRTARATADLAPRRQELFAWFIAPSLLLLAVALVREFPAFPRLPARPPRLPAATARVAPFLLALLAAGLGAPSATRAAPSASAPTPAPAPADPLIALVDKLAAADEPAASDFARLADLTASRGEEARASADPGAQIPEGALRDALAAVSAGQTADPRAADWPALRKRLETLLAPPPKPPQQQPQDKQQQQKSDPQKSPEQKSQDNNPSPQDSSSKPEKSSSDTENKSSPESQKSPSDSGQSSDKKDPSSSDSGSTSSSPKPKPDDSKPLGDLAQKPDAKKSEDEKSEGEKASAPAEQPPPEDAPAQQAGGVSASGRPADAEAAADAAALDPALAVPRQRLERVRDADAPARLFQLLQDSENPPEDRERRAGGNRQTW